MRIANKLEQCWLPFGWHGATLQLHFEPDRRDANCSLDTSRQKKYLTQTVIPSLQHDLLGRHAMMGRLNHDQGQLFYSFCLADAACKSARSPDADQRQ
jgi:uncharacterized protein (DUF2235 family)